MDEFKKLFTESLEETFGFSGWHFESEAEFKHELFHRLATKQYSGTPLGSKVPDTESCRLHAEGKIRNGIPIKADLLICNPKARQSFNYSVEYLIEMKLKLTQAELDLELQKYSRYGDLSSSSRGFYVVGNEETASRLRYAPFTGLEVFDRSNIAAKHSKGISASEKRGDAGLQECYSIVTEAAKEVLALYGQGRRQFQSFFWCNYEHETSRRHSFPCEGDFNAQLYHRLRTALPDGITVRSEVSCGTGLRLDLVVQGPDWRIPIETKMNWDQFKQGFKNGQPRKREAERLIDKIGDVASGSFRPKGCVIVIQGEWMLPRDIRKTELPRLHEAAKRSPAEIELLCFNEIRDQIEVFKLGA